MTASEAAWPMRLGLDSNRKLRRTTIFVIGAGFSADLGYPLTKELLQGLSMTTSLRKVFNKVVKFHHPEWNGKKLSLPDIETLLTEWTANEELLPSLRPKGPFTANDLRGLRRGLFAEIADWFHEIHQTPVATRGVRLQRFVRLVARVRNPIIISFNWDCELDRVLCGGRSRQELYGLNKNYLSTPIVLKPHGSLNWYEFNPGKHIKKGARETIWSDNENRRNSRFCFIKWRAPKSTRRQYVPWIVPPTHVKNFKHEMLRKIWRTCVDCLSVAREIYFVGYSLPDADWHSRYIFRCGFHNQIEGRPVDRGCREKPTGRAKVFIVNPDMSVRKGIETVAGYKCQWIPKKAKSWLKDLA